MSGVSGAVCATAGAASSRAGSRQQDRRKLAMRMSDPSATKADFNVDQRCVANLARNSSRRMSPDAPGETRAARLARSEEHTSELQSLMRISYAVFCLKKKNTKVNKHKAYTEQNLLTPILILKRT